MASQLQPTSESDQLLRDDHPFQRWIDSFNEDFGVGSDTTMKRVSVVFGLDDPYYSRENLQNRYTVGEGLLLVDSEFSVAAPASQEFVFNLCQDMLTAAPEFAGSARPLVRDQLNPHNLEQTCWVTGFKNYIESEICFKLPGEDTCFENGATGLPTILKEAQTFPVPEVDFHASLKDWINYREATAPTDGWPPHLAYEQTLAFENDTLIGFFVSANSTMQYWDAAYTPTVEAYEAWDKWMDDWVGKIPSDSNLGTPFHTCDGNFPGWVFMNTQYQLIFNALLGIVLSICIAFIILTFSTLNPFLAFLSIFDIMCVVAVILGTIYARGWALGQIESIAATILVGLAVDYVVHVANAYMESPALDRAGRVKSALAEMGGTVFGGAITSLGASMFLLICNLQIFAKFGFFMMCTVGLSFLYVFFFFVPVLLLMGPEGNCCMMTCCCKKKEDPPRVDIEMATPVS